MKILLISPLPPPAGGISTWTQKYLEYFASSNYYIGVVNIAVTGKRVLQINAKRNYINEIIRTKNIIKDLRVKLLEKPDVVHLNAPCNGLGLVRDYICGLMIKRKNILLLVHYHCSVPDHIDRNILRRIIFKKLTLLADEVIVLNNCSKKYIENYCGIKSKKVANYIDNEFVCKVPHVINEKVNKVVYVGHVIRNKGVLDIISTAVKLPNIQFVLAGPVSDDINSITRPENVVFLGEVTRRQVFDLLSSSDLFLFPTYSEGFSIALLEAMARGLPIITTPVGANRDMLEDKGGILVDAGDIDGILRAFKTLEDHSVRKQMSIWNVEKVKRYYLQDKVLKRLTDIYDGVVRIK